MTTVPFIFFKAYFVAISEEAIGAHILISKYNQHFIQRADSQMAKIAIVPMKTICPMYFKAPFYHPYL